MSACERWAEATLPLEPSVLAQAAREASRRAAELRLDEAAFVERLRADRGEMERLLRIVVPPETWLFRHAAAFEQVRTWLQSRPGVPARLLSLGCARGAEAFSLAATAASLGRSARDTEIVGVDWCADNLRDAEAGTSSPLAQRAPLPAWAAPWFEPDARGWLRLRDEPRRMIRWLHADMLRDAVPGPAQVVMCRNVAIYLDGRARAELAHRLDALTDHDGLLCVGHADPACLWEAAFGASDQPASFTHRRRAPPPVVKPPSTPPRTLHAQAPAAPAAHATEMAQPPEKEPDTRLIERAGALADEGRLGESAAVLEPLLARRPMHHEAWSILGAVRLAQARPDEAEACFRKVVYLQPSHALSLLQLSALAQARGEHDAADRLRLRAARAATGVTE